MFVDNASFVELAAHFKDAGVVTGYATVDGRLVYVYSQYGTVTHAHAKKLAWVYDAALKMGAPVVGILDSDGLEVSDGQEIFETYGMIFSKQAEASGIVPQIAVVAGQCMGTAAFMAKLSDFVLMAEDSGSLFLNSPNAFDSGAPKDDVKSAAYHSEVTGNVHFAAKTEAEVFDYLKQLIGFLPSNNLDEVPTGLCGDDINREDAALNTLIKDGFNINAVIDAICDDGKSLNVRQRYATNVITCFGRLNGCTAAIIANNGTLDNRAVNKITDFINFCDVYNIPVITLTDAAGLKISENEEKYLLRNAAKLIYTFANITVPKINVVVKDAVGLPYLLMNSRFLGADVVLAWEGSNIAVMDKEAARKVMGMDLDTAPLNAASKGYVDDIIAPSLTRKRIVYALEMLYTKRVQKRPKKHGTALL